MIVCEVFPCSQRQEHTQDRSTGHRRREGNMCAQTQRQLNAHIFIGVPGRTHMARGRVQTEEGKNQNFQAASWVHLIDVDCEKCSCKKKSVNPFGLLGFLHRKGDVFVFFKMCVLHNV